MFKRRWLAMLIAGLVLAAGCGSGNESKGGETPKSKEASKSEETSEMKTPDVITVQHILIGFQGSVPGKPITRTREEAQALAQEVFEKAKAGDFDALVKEYTDDSYPGIYSMANNGVPADPSKGIYPRSGMVPAFGNVGFGLGVGEVGMAPYDEQTSPYGWHIIKRIK
jgi:hypothetical protein